MVRLLGEACLDCSFSFWGVVSDGKLRREFPTLLSITTEKEPPNSVYCTVGGAPSNEVGQTFTQREVLSLGKTLAAL